MSHVAAVIGIDGVFEVTPTISSSPTYSSGDQIGGIIQLSGAIRTLHRPLDGNNSQATSLYGRQRGYSLLTEIFVKNKVINVTPILNFWIFNELPTMTSVDNGAFNFADSELTKLVGIASMDTTYFTSSSNSAASKTNLNVLCPQVSTMATNDLWVVTQTLTGGLFTSTSDLTFVFKFYHD
jgi:hypothetical protein